GFACRNGGLWRLRTGLHRHNRGLRRRGLRNQPKGQQRRAGSRAHSDGCHEATPGSQQMKRTTSLLSFLLASLALQGFWSTASENEPKPPPGFRAIFNGKDLTDWYGLNPHNGAQLKGEQKEANLKQQRADFPKHWRVENGELVNDGTGPYATTEAEFGDIELRVEYRTVPRADSGIYLRGTPQVQIWDWNQVFDPKNPTRKPHLGSGGL